ncbi:hypothetical protein RU97_GL000696 [Enterococcus canis]|uniref:Uncharacterized protein n=1 Tax=Enterococcus canis TaxID=214095 RepID=A0A1L8RB88_9ENTE|nr:hypothetical protein RU97_GL000696 [Enterococcus canis]
MPTKGQGLEHGRRRLETAEPVNRHITWRDAMTSYGRTGR